ncbi:MAG TPA: SHOCT domain-containing protein [Firmicutes bacterium]|nr:SHOCT domain-containing protein [Bacillota bacterium]
MWPYWYGGSFGVWGWVLMLVHAVLWVGVVALGVYLVARALRHSGMGPAPERVETPLEILRRRYAAGEISSEDYQRMKEELKHD